MRVIAIDPHAIPPEGVACAPASSFLQTPFWASFKERHGWKPLYFLVEGAGVHAPFPLTVLVRRVARVASIAYVPMGPDVDIAGRDERSELLVSLSRLLRPFLPAMTLCVRFDPPWGTVEANSGKDEEGEGTLERPSNQIREVPVRPVRRASADVQPPDTVILDLTLDEETLLSAMKPKWRYNVRLGEKKGVTIRSLAGKEAEEAGIDAFYALYLETSARDGIAIHSRAYYRDLVRHAEEQAARPVRSPLDKSASVRVYLAEHEGDLLASIVTLFSGDEAVYLYGASSNEKRNLMPAYSLQWRAIRDAKAAGCARYDFYGIPPTNDPAHPMYGLYRFKTGFGGSIVHRVGSLDVPTIPVFYECYRVAESLRAFWFKKAVKAIRRETPRKS